MESCPFFFNSANMTILIILLFIWDAIWKIIAMWKAASNNQKLVFILLAILNTIGIFPIIYILLKRKK